LLQLAGNFVTANLGTITLTSAGTAEITGNLDNTGNTLTAPGGGAYALSGTLKSGTIVDTAITQKSARSMVPRSTAHHDREQHAHVEKFRRRRDRHHDIGNGRRSNGSLYLDSALSTLSGSNLTLTGTNTFVTYHSSVPTLSIVATAISRARAAAATRPSIRI